jgi:RNA polymerase sigma factor (sigma-70 family)
MTHPSEEVRRAFEGTVAANAKAWREAEEAQETLWAVMESLPPELADEAVNLVRWALNQDLADCVRQLHSRFGVLLDARWVDARLRWEVHQPPEFRASDEEAGLYSSLLVSALTSGHILCEVAKVINEGRDPNDCSGTLRPGDAERALEALRKASAEAPVVLTGIAQANAGLAPLLEQQQAASLSAAGWADGHIWLYQRLADALESEGSIKRQALPAASFSGWAERTPGEPLTGKGSTVNRIAELLAKKKGQGKEAPSEQVDGIELGFEDRVLARLEMEDLVRRAELSNREAQVLFLSLQEYTQKEIAEELGVAEGTVKSLWSRARQKIDGAHEASGSQ